jgi:hypothetical protein
MLTELPTWLEAECFDKNGHRRHEWVRKYDGRYWFLKTSRKELLAYNLGRRFVNIAEVRLSPTEISANAEDVIILLSQCHNQAELPIQDLDEAVAAEFAFSLLIKRRDLHAFNRAYVNGLPVFFDCASAFPEAEADCSLDNFFQSTNSDIDLLDWKVWSPDENFSVDTINSRTSWQNGCKGLIVNNEETFKEKLVSKIQHFSSLSSSDIQESIQESGIHGNQAKQISECLKISQDQLSLLTSNIFGIEI